MATNKVINMLRRPVSVYGTSMSPSILLMCKIFVLLLVAHGFYSSISDPYIPFLEGLNNLNEYPRFFEITLKSLFVIAGLSLIFNFKVRLSAILIAMTIFLAIIASKPLFRNHLFVIGCMLFLSGLSEKNKAPWLLYFQLSVIYFGALLNKMLQIEWWSGQFMHNWLSVALENPLYNAWFDATQSFVLAKIMSYSAMFVELVIGVILLIPKFRFYAITLILVFHTILFSFTGETFGYFMEDVLIILIAFRSWPKDKSEVKYSSSSFNEIFITFFKLIDFDKRFVLKRRTIKPEINATIEGRVYNGRKAIVHMLLSTTGFYILLLFSEMGIRFVFDGVAKYICLMILFWSLIWFLSPILFEHLKKKI